MRSPTPSPTCVASWTLPRRDWPPRHEAPPPRLPETVARALRRGAARTPRGGAGHLARARERRHRRPRRAAARLRPAAVAHPVGVVSVRRRRPGVPEDVRALAGG